MTEFCACRISSGRGHYFICGMESSLSLLVCRLRGVPWDSQNCTLYRVLPPATERQGLFLVRNNFNGIVCIKREEKEF